jgi:hypothetical protein
MATKIVKATPHRLDARKNDCSTDELSRRGNPLGDGANPAILQIWIGHFRIT